MKAKTETLKKKIKEKFGTYSKFAKLADLDRYAFQRDFLVKKEVDEIVLEAISYKYLHTKNKSLAEALTSKEIKAMKKAIDEAGGVIAFAREFPHFSQHTLFQILAGKYKTKTKMVKTLMQTLSI